MHEPLDLCPRAIVTIGPRTGRHDREKGGAARKLSQGGEVPLVREGVLREQLMEEQKVVRSMIVLLVFEISRKVKS